MANTIPRPIARRLSSSRHQRGVVFIVTLLMLIAITMAGLALFRTVGTGAIIAGNLAFKQAATSAGDRGIEFARNWLTNSGGSTGVTIPVLQGTNKVTGYYPAWCFDKQADWDGTWTPASANSDCAARNNSTNPPFNPFTYTWTDSNSILVSPAPDAMGNSVRYVIHRLCSMDGAPNEVREFAAGTKAIQSCVLTSGALACDDRGLAYADSCLALSFQPYYRVTAQVTGPRNTVSYVEVLLY